MAGIDVGGISVGGFSLIRSGENWVFRFDLRRWVGDGYFKPLTRAGGFRVGRYTWMVAGGPLTSMFFTVVCGYVSVQFGDGGWDWIGSLFWTSLTAAVSSIIPYSSGLNKSDGKLLWALLRDPEQERLTVAVLTLQTEEAKGLRPREWDTEQVKQVLRVPRAASEYPHCQLMAFYLRLEEGRQVDALVHLENVLASSARSGDATRHAFYLEAASSSALSQHKCEQART